MAQWSRKLLFIFIETRLELLAPRSDKEAIAPKDMITKKKFLNYMLSIFFKNKTTISNLLQELAAGLWLTRKALRCWKQM